MIWKFQYVLIVTLLCGRADFYRIQERIYQNIQGDKACFKRFNGTHEIGCTSDFWGNVGIIHYAQDLVDIDWIINVGPHPPYTAAISVKLLTADVLRQLSDSGKLSGILVLDSEESERTESFSTESNCPNEGSSLYKNTVHENDCNADPWNPYGSSLLFQSWNFPIFLVRDKESIGNITECFFNYNNYTQYAQSQEWPLCAVELQSNMFGTTNSRVCTRRTSLSVLSYVNFCDPLHDNNIWGSISPLNRTEYVPVESIIVVGTRADATSLFTKISPGSEAAVSGLVTVILAAQALYKHKEDLKDSENNILFILFEGEAFDYIGSSRMVYDMKTGEFPYKYGKDESPDRMPQLNLTHIKHFIDIEQVGLTEGNNMYLHIDPISDAQTAVRSKNDDLIHVILGNSVNINFTTERNVSVPPSSIQSFLKHANLSGLVITDHKKAYLNRNYGSIYDDYRALNYSSTLSEPDSDDVLHKRLAGLASSLASALYELVKKEKKQIVADVELANELLFCYLRNINCSLFRQHGDSISDSYFKPEPAVMYTSVRRGEVELSIITRSLLADFMGDKVDVNYSDCKSDSKEPLKYYYFSYIDNGTCKLSTVHDTVALSPAFILNDYDWESGEYSTWCESGWDHLKARIFLRPSPKEEITLIIIGMLVIVLASLLVYFVNLRADVIFPVINPAPC